MPRKVAPRIHQRIRDPRDRVECFDEVALGYTAEQAVAEAQRCLQCPKQPCVQGCPVGIDIPGFVRLVSLGRFGEAARRIKEANSLPAVCGRVCPQENQCEGRCVLQKLGQPVSVGAMERFVADWEREHGADPVGEDGYAEPDGQSMRVEREERGESGGPGGDSAVPEVGRGNGGTGRNPRVAVVGSGPAGITAASDLAKAGCDVVIFEALHAPGGVLSYGIPEFRLPKRILEHEFDYVRRLGVRIETDVLVGKTVDVGELMRQKGFDAVFIGTGAGLPHFLNIPGENLNGVLSANEFLTRINLMKAYRFPEYATPFQRARQTVVVGGGNTAMDAARTALRLGSDVTLVYRRSRQEMPARAEEVVHAEEEGVKFELLTNPTRILGENGWTTGVECIRNELGEPDASGRRLPVPLPGSEFIIPADCVIVAVGQSPNPVLLQSTPGLDIDRRNTIRVDNATGETSLEGVFAGGDATSGGTTVIEAMGDGRRAARAILDYLRQKVPGTVLELSSRQGH
ncbi:MAG: NADPH-dependent glutamate synthase [Firmicutes bacterium]|nr:NADPH-dependent glutamate synthase [Bacillota bacterium]